MSSEALLQAPESLREAVVAEIDDDPMLDAWSIGVTAEAGVVTLTGTVDSLAKKEAAARAAKRVDGVRSIANDLRVRGAHWLHQRAAAETAVKYVAGVKAVSNDIKIVQT